MVFRSVKIRNIIRDAGALAGANTLAGNVGDPYLFKHNLIFRNLRESAINAGIQFTQKDFYSYKVFPLGSIDSTTKSRHVIYFDNMQPLLKLEEDCPGLFRLNNLVGLHRNPMVHETTHAISARLKEKSMTPFPVSERTSKRGEMRRDVLSVMVSESFATTYDTLFMLDADSQYHLEMALANGFPAQAVSFELIQPMQATLSRIFNLVGRAGAAKLLALGFLHSNFLYRKLDSVDLSRALGVAFELRRFSASDRRTLKRLFDLGLTNQPSFVISTARFYFQQRYRRSVDLFRLLSFDFMRSLERDSDLLDHFETMAQLAVEKVRLK